MLWHVSLLSSMEYVMDFFLYILTVISNKYIFFYDKELMNDVQFGSTGAQVTSKPLIGVLELRLHVTLELRTLSG